MTTKVTDEATTLFEVEGLITVTKLSDGGLVVVRSGLVGKTDEVYLKAISVAQEETLHGFVLHEEVVEHSSVERTPFAGSFAVAELWV